MSITTKQISFKTLFVLDGIRGIPSGANSNLPSLLAPFQGLGLPRQKAAAYGMPWPLPPRPSGNLRLKSKDDRVSFLRPFLDICQQYNILEELWPPELYPVFQVLVKHSLV